MHTSEFDEVTKNYVGRRLREVLSGKRTTKQVVRAGEKNIEKAWLFKRNTLERIAKKYGYYKDFMERLNRYTDLPNLPISQGIKEHKTTSEKHGKQSTLTFPESVKSVNRFNIKEVVEIEPYVDRCFHCQRVEVLHWQAETFKGEWGHVCNDCGELFKEILKKRGEVS